MMRASELRLFLDQIGIAAEDGRETPNTYALKDQVRVAQLKSLTQQAVTRLTKRFGASISFKVIAGAPDYPLFEITGGQAQRAWSDVHAGFDDDDDHTLTVDLSIDKQGLLTQLGLTEGPHHSIFYLFQEKLAELLRAPLPTLDEELFTDGQTPTLLIASDLSAARSGPFLSVTNLEDLDQTRQTLESYSHRMPDRAGRARAAAEENLSWRGFRLRHLTPFHFLCGQGNIEPEIENLLQRHLVHLCILYTANRSAYDDGCFLASYASADRTVTLSLGDLSASIPRQALSRLALWPFDGREKDRLVILQNVVARSIQGEDSEQNYSSFLDQIPRLVADARWHYRVFVDGQLDAHFDQVRAVTNYVASVAKEVSGSLDAMTKDLTSSLRTTVGVVVLTLIASLIKEGAQGLIFSAGMFAYAGFLFLVQVVYHMGSVWHSYRLLTREANERLDLHRTQLGAQRVSRLAEPIENRKSQFVGWFFGSGAIYILVIALLVLLALFLPEHLETLPSSVPASGGAG